MATVWPTGSVIAASPLRSISMARRPRTPHEHSASHATHITTIATQLDGITPANGANAAVQALWKPLRGA